MNVITRDRAHRTMYSMRWAAWADALGFISELTTETGLRRRLHGKQLIEPVSWTRRVGGKFGVDMTLPAGCYSDDTQLRLATARAIRANGFDVEAFAKVELAAWPSYALGGGRATKAAAANITKASTPWFANFHDGWVYAGGNGVAMRIQPHVWAAPRPEKVGPHILDVILNGVTTHGHPRALVGAVFHALSLGHTLHDGHVPPPEKWPELLDATAHAVNLIGKHQQLATVWCPEWEHRTQQSFAAAWHQTVDECLAMLPAVTQAVKGLSGEGNSLSSSATAAYEDLIRSLELRDPARRGSGTTTVVAALALAAASPADPASAARLAAQAIGTDTDTIATMAAALIGATDTAPQDTTLRLLDIQYLTSEAIRLVNIADGKETKPFSYPDLLHWAPPRNHLDWVGLAGSDLAMAGLCWLKPVESSKSAEARGTIWQWAHSDFGPSFLVKRRADLRELPKNNWPIRRDEIIDLQVRAHLLRTPNPPGQLSLVEDTEEKVPSKQQGNDSPSESAQARSGSQPANQHTTESADIDQMLAWVAGRRYSVDAIGYATRRIAQIGTVEQLVAFATALRSAIRKSTK